MKKYNQPKSVVVKLGTFHMMAESLPVNDDIVITNPDDSLTKENKDVNVWDEYG